MNTLETINWLGNLRAGDFRLFSPAFNYGEGWTLSIRLRNGDDLMDLNEKHEDLAAAVDALKAKVDKIYNVLPEYNTALPSPDA